MSFSGPAHSTPRRSPELMKCFYEKLYKPQFSKLSNESSNTTETCLAVGNIYTQLLAISHKNIHSPLDDSAEIPTLVSPESENTVEGDIDTVGLV